MGDELSLLNKLGEKYRIDVDYPPSTVEEIESLLMFATIDVPEEFLAIIREKTEIEINVAGEKYLRLWGAKGCIEMNKAYFIQQYIPNSLAIGDDEGGNALLYVKHEDGIKLYMVAFNDLEIEEMQYVANSLYDLFIHYVGIEVIKNC